MSKRYLDDVDAFDNDDVADSPSLTDIDSNLFSKIQEVDDSKQIARPYDIFDIVPDPAQPRRAVPSLVRGDWSGNPEQCGELFQVWLEFVNREREHTYEISGSGRGVKPFPLEEHLRAEADVSVPDSVGFLEASFLSLIELAVSIKLKGLTNPITIARIGPNYQLETGERRWLAYHLLHWVFGDDSWRSIPARVVRGVNIWRQAAENNARANLNAIGKARQFAVLLMDLLAEEHNMEFAPFDEVVKPGGFDRAYYAQVKDPTEDKRYRIPRGKSEALYSVLGLKNRRQLRDYRKLLRLPDYVWQVADDLNWTEYFIRSLTEQAQDDDHLVTLTIIEAEKAGYGVGHSVPTGTVSDKPSRRGKKPSRKVKITPGTRQHFTQLTRALQQTGAGKVEKNQQALSMIDDLREWLEREEQRLRDYLDS